MNLEQQIETRSAFRIATSDISLAGALLVTAIILPIGFHFIGLGPTFLPMYVPVLIAGLVLRPRLAAIVGGLSPIVSLLVTGMPPPPFAALMVVELIVLGVTASMLSTGSNQSLWFAVIGAILIRCLVSALFTSVFGSILHLPNVAIGFAGVFTGFPGIMLQLIVAAPAAMWLRNWRGTQV